MRYNFQKLKNTIADFCKITNIMVVLYDEQFRFMYGYPQKNNPFCEEVRKSEHLTQKCTECDNFALEYCRKKKSTFIYRCHMGMLEAVTPIMDDDTPIGYLMIGQVTTERDKKAIIDIVTTMPNDSNIDKQKLIESLSSITSITTEMLSSITNILEVYAYYLLSKDIIQPFRTELEISIKKYIKKNLCSPELSLSSICQAFSISRSTLYNLSNTSFGMGISDYIRYCRIDHAKTLLQQGNMSIQDISATCCFSSPSHFTRTFKQIVGMYPKQYMQQFKPIK
ncbi:MAG: PocR ligand-binding domain-containing protein [Clostridia bacterium]|nr:PocR ligand-binding domain-containing protein [Clostridia bacterium]